jgi:hypothetical protein
MRIEVREEDGYRRRPRLVGWLVVRQGEIALEAAPLPRDGLPCPSRDNMMRLRADATRLRRVLRDPDLPRLLSRWERRTA